MLDFSKIKYVAVLGGGESGTGAAVLSKERGFETFLSDAGKLAPRYVQLLDSEGIAYEQGGHTPERITCAQLIIKSPGIPDSAPMVAECIRRGIPVISEIEFAGYFTDAKMVCITGSNGKTTTTLLTYHILQSAGLNVGLAGNVGRSLALQVAKEPKDVYVIELSSFQLDNMYRFRANVAVILNITPDHLDRYDHKMENYVAAKFRILQNQTSRDAFIYWQDDPVIKAQLDKISVEARRYPFGETREEDTAAYLDAEDRLMVNTPGNSFSMPRADLALHGLHNLYNSMAAALSGCLLDIRKDTLRTALSDFGGVEHRLEPVCDINGVEWINDSKATNVNSCYYALESMTRPTILILGGKDKGNDYSEILPLVHQKVKAIVAMGVDNDKILKFFGPEVPEIYDTHSLDEAVQRCAALAQEGDAVLLSPCCASFDLFSSYEDRGRKFKDAVRALTL